MKRMLTVDEWVERYGVLCDVPGGQPRRLDVRQAADADQVLEAPEGCLWSLVVDERIPVIVSGRHTVECLGYYVSRQPWMGEVRPLYINAEAVHAD